MAGNVAMNNNRASHIIVENDPRVTERSKQTTRTYVYNLNKVTTQEQFFLPSTKVQHSLYLDLSAESFVWQESEFRTDEIEPWLKSLGFPVLEEVFSFLLHMNVSPRAYLVSS